MLLKSTSKYQFG